MLLREESQAWRDVYSSDDERARRRKAMPEKLRRLGIAEVDRNAKILDLCCGTGEALDTLHEMGFTQLSGLDVAIPETLQRDPRFALRAGDARQTGYPDSSFDWVINIHAMHHLGMADDVERFLDECYRIIKPGGYLGIVDFPNSLQIRLAFWFFRQQRFLFTRYTKNFGRVIQEEWHFLRNYLPQWPLIDRMLRRGRFELVSNKNTIFYFHMQLRKPN